MSTMFFQPTYRGNFTSGWDKYVERGAFGSPMPDVYWNPRVGQWRAFAPNSWRFVDENLPAISKVDFLTNAGEIFDQITQQWSGLAARQQQAAVWDGRRHKWVVAEPLDKGKGTCREQYEEKLAYLRQLHSSGDLTDELFEEQAKDLWERYAHCV